MSAPSLHSIRSGRGEPLVLIHGLSGSSRSWDPIASDLAAHREVVAVDLPGFGDTPPPPGEVSIDTLTDAMEAFLLEQDLVRADLVGSSMGARIVLELARRGIGGDAVALAPGGFAHTGERRVFGVSLRASRALVAHLGPMLPTLVGSPVGRTALLSQFSARPWALDGEVVLAELRRLISAPSTGAAIDALADGPNQQGAPAGTLPGRLTIGWGRSDRVALPRQAARALEAFPDATLRWFDACGHFPHWDAPAATVAVVLAGTGSPTR